MSKNIQTSMSTKIWPRRNKDILCRSFIRTQDVFLHFLVIIEWIQYPT